MPSSSRDVSLPTGVLRLTWSPQRFQLDDLCDFACRRNANRSFLFVSKVLGRYQAVEPVALRTTSQQLASQLLQFDLPGPVVFVGLVEAGVALGHAVFEDALTQSGRNDFLFLQTTRYRLKKPVLAEFSEEHSHAPQHFLYQPGGNGTASQLAQAKSLVLVDDEATSGRTFDNLYRALAPQLPHLSHVRDVTVTDWRPLSKKRERACPTDYQQVSLFRGAYDFQTNGVLPGRAENAKGNGKNKDAGVDLGLGRLGIQNKLQWDASSLDNTLRAVQCSTFGKNFRNNRILVVGTGEFVYPPFLLAEHLASKGCDVEFITTTRSPVERGLSVESVLAFADNYADNIPNYIYNVPADRYARVLFCQETAVEATPWSAIAELGADVLQFTSQPGAVVHLKVVSQLNGGPIIRRNTPARVPT